jgi:hypothetical protein
MHFTSSSRARWIVAIGAIVILGSAFLQWWQIGGAVGELDARAGLGIEDGRVLWLMFWPSIACLLLVTLPFASEKPVAIDHPVVYLGLLAVIFGGYVWRVGVMVQQLLIPWPPTRGIGLWMAALGLLLLARGVFETFEERRRRLY